MKNKEKKVYGELENVLLTDAEYGKLKQKFPDDFEDKINAVGFYMDSSGKKYKSHYATILMWDRRDKEKEKRGAIPQSAKPTAPFTQGNRSGNRVKRTRFTDYEQRKTDYDEIEKRALDALMGRRRA